MNIWTRFLLPSHLNRAVNFNSWRTLSSQEDFVEFLFALFSVVAGKYLANLNCSLFYAIKLDWEKKSPLFIIIFVASNGYTLLSFINFILYMTQTSYLQIQVSFFFFQKIFLFSTCNSSVLFFASSILGTTYVELTSLVCNIYYFFLCLFLALYFFLCYSARC